MENGMYHEDLQNFTEKIVMEPDKQTNRSRHSIDSHTFLDILPWNDVIFKAVLPCLPIKSLFLLRRVNTKSRNLVDCFFEENNILDLVSISHKFNERAFKIATEHATKLHILILRNAQHWLCGELLQPVFFNNPKIQHLDLTNCSNLNSSVLQALGASCLNLLKLVMIDCHWLDLDGLTAVALGCSKLEHVNLMGCWNLDDEAIQTLVMGCPRLVYISIARIYGLTDSSLCFIARNSEYLEHINIQCCWRVTNDGVRALGEYCKNLKALQARDCRDVTEESLKSLRQKEVKVDKAAPAVFRSYFGDAKHRLHVQI